MQKYVVIKTTEDGDVLPPPRTRGECVNAERPCPHLNCKHNTWGPMLADCSDEALEKLPVDSCVLDVADRGGHTLDEVGGVMGGVSRQRILQVEKLALARLKKQLGLRDLNMEDLSTGEVE